jgi:hypothetical protein
MMKRSRAAVPAFLLVRLYADMAVLTAYRSTDGIAYAAAAKEAWTAPRAP